MGDVILKADRMSKRYGSVQAVDGISLEVREGEILGFLGPNGAGKTTSISMMCGLLSPDSGRVLVRGEDARSRDARQRIGVCPQNAVLWGMLTCLEQLVFMGRMHDVPAKTARARGIALLDSLGLSEKRDTLGRALSGGMKRRLNLALALIHDPEIVILDEPEAGLDPQGRVLVRRYIRSLAGKKTIILTTHNMDEADRLSDRVAIMDKGRLLTLDTPEELKRRVGEGDVLEIDLGDVNGGAAEGAAAGAAMGANAIAAISALAPSSRLVERTIVVRELKAVEMLPPLIERLKAAGHRPGEIRLRQNTLEDVFISMTGERLRE